MKGEHRVDININTMNNNGEAESLEIANWGNKDTRVYNTIRDGHAYSTDVGDPNAYGAGALRVPWGFTRSMFFVVFLGTQPYSVYDHA